jgi:hypothetical protein
MTKIMNVDNGHWMCYNKVYLSTKKMQIYVKKNIKINKMHQKY